MKPLRLTVRATVLAVVLAAGACLAGNVALLTDYGTDDHYVGVLEGAILKVAPEARLVTITHQVPSFDLREGSYLLGLAAAEFPPGTIFVAVVDPGVGGTRRPIVIETEDGKLLVGPDNGLFTDVIGRLGLRHAFEITNDTLTRAGVKSSTFHGRDLFGPVAGHLAAGVAVAQVGPEIRDPVRLPTQPARIEGARATGMVVHRDHYGNLLTNIPAALVERVGLRHGQTVAVRVGGRTVRAPLVASYGDVARGAFGLVVNSEGNLELARNQASAGEALGIRAGAQVSVGRR